MSKERILKFSEDEKLALQMWETHKFSEEQILEAASISRERLYSAIIAFETARAAGVRQRKMIGRVRFSSYYKALVS